MHRLTASLLVLFAVAGLACSRSTAPTTPEPAPFVSLDLSIGSDAWHSMEPPSITHSMGRITIVSRRLHAQVVEEFSLAMLDTIRVGRHVLHADSAACAYFSLGGSADSTSMSNVRLYTGWLDITKRTDTEIEGTFEAHFGYNRKRGAGRFTARLAH